MRCYYCGNVMTNSGKPSARSARQATVDHVIPTSRGGEEHAKHNKVRCCQACNRDKGGLTIEEYRVVLMFRRNMLPGYVYAMPKPLLFWGEKLREETLT